MHILCVMVMVAYVCVLVCVYARFRAYICFEVCMGVWLYIHMCVVVLWCVCVFVMCACV